MITFTRLRPSLVCAVLLLLAACGDRTAKDRAAAAAVHATHAEAALEAKQWARALLAAEQAVAYDPLDPRHRDLLTRVKVTALATAPGQVQLDRAAELEYQAEVLATQDPARTPVYETALGYFSLARNDVPGASAHFQAAVRAGPDWAPAQVGLAQALARQQKHGEALAALDQALKADPGNPAGLVTQGRVRAAQGEHARAIESFTRAATSGESAELHLELGTSLMALRRSAEAGEHFRRAVQLAPRSGDAHRRLGEWLLANGQDDAAATEFTTGAQLGAEPFSTFGLGMVLQRKGAFAEAGKHFAAVSSAAPELVEAAFQAGFSFDRAGDTQSAAQLYARYIQLAGTLAPEQARVGDVKGRLEKLATQAAAPASPEGAPLKKGATP